MDHHRNTNQNPNEISSHIYQNDCCLKDKRNVGEDVEKREPLYTVDENVFTISTIIF